MFGLEVTVALGTAETEVFAVIAYEQHSVSGVDGSRAEVATLDSHQQSLL